MTDEQLLELRKDVTVLWVTASSCAQTGSPEVRAAHTFWLRNIRQLVENHDLFMAGQLGSLPSPATLASTRVDL